jgi:hypothetical protein
MKTLVFAFIIAALAAVGAELKDPAAVARDWNHTVAQIRPPLAPDSQSLAGQSDLLTTTPLERIFQVEGNAPPLSAPRAGGTKLPLLDAPNYHIPRNLPNNRPKGAIPWEFNGEVYWLVPLTPKADR